MSEVTPCCGCSYENSWISDCCTVEMYNNDSKCPACKENTEATGYICNECGNWTETLEERSEYKARMKENYYEEMADARRKYGE
tara:strand:+ start:232 stop:483 length:252 start_codon:yes stop_codon:yes gene_type:complete